LKQTKYSLTLVLSLSTLILLLSIPNSTITLIYCPSFVPVEIEDVLAGLADTRTDPRRSCPDGVPPMQEFLGFCAVTHEDRFDRLSIPV
jgi:hypothetical protein